MKYLKTYRVFEAEPASLALTEEQISWLDDCTTGIWKLNQSTGLIDIEGAFDCGSQGLKELKGVKFGKVSEDFDCDGNQLTSLAGAPQTVNRDFSCYGNQLTSLVGAPQTVGGSFSCRENQLTTLEGAPQTVGGSFYCDQNQLTSLVGAPQTVKGNFFCSDNQLTTLAGAPQTVKGSFYCYENQLTTLEGAPQTVSGNFYCDQNQLTSLEGAPQTVNRDFYCYENPVSEETLESIFRLMKNGKSYQQALEEYWPKMGDEDRTLMYKDHSSLTPEETRKYKALATYGNIKGYL